MSKKQEIGGVSEKGRMVDITNNHLLWVAKKIDGVLVVEKFVPGKKSEHSLYIECGSDECKKNPVNKVFIPQDVEYFMNERNKVSQFLCKCNTFAHMALRRQICVEFAKIIVKAEDQVAYDRLCEHSNLAENAQKVAEEKSQQCPEKYRKIAELS